MLSVKQINAQFCFNTPAIYASTGSSPESIASADFNGDGFADLAVVNSGNSNVTIFLSNGLTGFANGVKFWAAGRSILCLRI